MEQHPDAYHYQYERAERFGCSQREICAALKRLKTSRKKNFFHPKVEEEACRLFKKKISVYNLMRLPLIYIDESGFAEDMPRMFGYAPTGMRCVGKHNMMSKRRTHVIGALTRDRLLTADLFDCSINADVFEAWLQQDLSPLLSNGAVVVMDNTSFHIYKRIQKAVEGAGCPSLNICRHILLI